MNFFLAYEFGATGNPSSFYLFIISSPKGPDARRSANRDLMRAMRADWHDEYTLSSLWQFYQPNRRAHGSYWFNWGTEQEVQWKKYYVLWMTFVNEYKNRGGRVAAGSDSGFIFQLYGFGFIRELELLREAGFHPLEVISAATIKDGIVYDAKALLEDVRKIVER